MVIKGHGYPRLYFSGWFTDYINTWTGAELSPMGTLPYPALIFIVYNGELYAAGGVDDNPPVSSTGFCAKWNGDSWEMVGSLSYGIWGAAILNNELYLCGGTGWNNEDGISYTVKWNGSSWVSVGSKPWANDGDMYTMCVFGGELYVSGDFTGHIAKFNPGANTWSVVGSTPLSHPVYWISAFGGDLYSIGWEQGIQKLSAGSWSEVGSESGGGAGEDQKNYGGQLENFNGKLYVCESIWNGSGYTKYVKRLDGSSWTAIGTVPDGVYTMRVFDNALYCGGGGGSVAGFMARLNAAGDGWDTIITPDAVVSTSGIFEGNHNEE